MVIIKMDFGPVGVLEYHLYIITIAVVFDIKPAL